MGLQFGVSYLGGDCEYVRVRRWPFSIGRNPANDLCLANSSLISRRHVRVFKDPEGYRLVASGTNPTYLNGVPVLPDNPVTIKPGDRIELPDYLLEVRDTSKTAPLSATINVEVVTTSAIVIRRVASLLGTPNWTVEAIHQWLGASQGREIWIHHHQVRLCLPGRIGIVELDQRLNLFDTLIADLDPSQLSIELLDPATMAVATD